MLIDFIPANKSNTSIDIDIPSKHERKNNGKWHDCGKHAINRCKCNNGYNATAHLKYLERRTITKRLNIWGSGQDTKKERWYFKLCKPEYHHFAKLSSKMFNRIILNKISNILDKAIRKKQNGFIEIHEDTRRMEYADDVCLFSTNTQTTQ